MVKDVVIKTEEMLSMIVTTANQQNYFQLSFTRLASDHCYQLKALQIY